MSVLPRPGEEPPLPGSSGAASEATLELVDLEVRRLVAECYGAALERLGQNRDRVWRLASALLQQETLEAEQAYRAAGFDTNARLTVNESDASMLDETADLG